MTPYERAILEGLQRPVTKQAVKGFGTVYMREMSIAERDARNIKLLGPKLDGAAPTGAWAVATIACTICDEAGSRCSEEFLAALPDAASEPFVKLLKLARKINGEDDSDPEKNSGTTPSSGSDTG